MEDKLIKIAKGTYIITDGNVNIIEGSFSEEELSNIYETSEIIEDIKQKITDCEKEIGSIDMRKNIDKKSLFVMRITPLCGYLLLLILSSPKTLLSVLLPLIPFVILQIAEEWLIKVVFNKKIEIDNDTEKTIKETIESLKQKQHLLEQEQKQNLEKTQYKETRYNGETIIKPIDHSQDEISIKITPLTRTLKK